jgi:hypothetical protein
MEDRQMIRRSVLGWRLAVCVCLLAAAASAYAQLSPTFVFNVQQEFSAANKKLPTGRYDLSRVAGGFLVQGPSGQVIVPIVTRLARYETSKSDEVRLVFDKLDSGELLLSEIWLPGEDGYLVCTLEKAHHHVTMNAQKK